MVWKGLTSSEIKRSRRIICVVAAGALCGERSDQGVHKMDFLASAQLQIGKRSAGCRHILDVGELTAAGVQSAPSVRVCSSSVHPKLIVLHTCSLLSRHVNRQPSVVPRPPSRDVFAPLHILSF